MGALLVGLTSVVVACAGRPLPAAGAAPAVVDRAELERLRGEAMSCAGAPSEWVVRTGHEGAAVVHPARLRADARRVASLLARADERVERYLGVPFSWAGVQVHLVADPRSPVKPGWVATYSARVDSGSVADVFMTSPACVHPALRSGLGVPLDLAYTERTLVHELAGPALHELTTSKAQGWRFYEAPSWFVQGMEEWIALSTEGEGAGAQLAAARRAALDVTARVSVRDASLEVADPYVDGRMLVAFLHHAIGTDGVHRLLRSDAETFEVALEGELKRDRKAFVAGYREWMRSSPAQ